MLYNKLPKIRNKQGAIEMSISTVVIIVLAMTMLILGIFLVQRIFDTTTTSITEIDQGVKTKINELFQSDNERLVAIYPDSRIIQVERGSRNQGFAVSLQNVDDSAQDLQLRLGSRLAGDCPPGYDTDLTVIGLDTTDRNFPNIGGKRSLENPVHVRFSVPVSAPLCTFTQQVIATDNRGSQPVDVQVEIVAE